VGIYEDAYACPSDGGENLKVLIPIKVGSGKCVHLMNPYGHTLCGLEEGKVTDMPFDTKITCKVCQRVLAIDDGEI
jgi:hypothetical protein